MTFAEFAARVSWSGAVKGRCILKEIVRLAHTEHISMSSIQALGMTAGYSAT